MYADHTTLYCNLSNNTNENDLNSELHKISEWLASNVYCVSCERVANQQAHINCKIDRRNTNEYYYFISYVAYILSNC